jgi:large subunit ribosomal protein L40
MAGEQGSVGAKAKEVHETINRAWLLHQKQKEKRRQKALQAKYESMRAACEALRQLAVGPHAIPSGPRLYDAAMVKPNPNKAAMSEPTPLSSIDPAAPIPKRSLAENKYFAARIGGLFPRELPVPTETWKNGERWDYEWKHPDSQ